MSRLDISAIFAPIKQKKADTDEKDRVFQVSPRALGADSPGRFERKRLSDTEKFVLFAVSKGERNKIMTYRG